MYIPLTSRIKIMADLDIAEKRVPQDGRIRYTSKGELYDFRVSTLPTHHGEKTVIRILKHDVGLLEMSKIGITPKDYEALSEIIEKPQGMIFVTGPTGSGKSSTLFACLNRIRTKAINITTIENPIEYKINGVNQVQINEKAGVTFAATLRSILRQDPDVILIGEIRDRETAEIAVQSAQTGHLVLSTLHTNDAVSAITRLRDLGIPGFLISSSLLCILAQRLVRSLCPHCKARADMAGETAERWKAMLPGIPLPPHYIPVGCDACHKTGFKGRTGIFELALVGDSVREMITQNATDGALRAFYRSAGMKTMVQNGIEKIEQGITSPEELLRVVMVEDILGLKQTVSENQKEII
jgi:type IV pilus assembly protein PilB